jgi:hypothetical protein
MICGPKFAPHPQIATPKNQRQEGSALLRLPGASFFDPQVTPSTFGHSTLNISLNTGLVMAVRGGKRKTGPIPKKCRH